MLAEKLLEIIPKFDALLVRSATQVTAEVLRAGTRLRVVGRAGVGVDNINVEAATQAGIVVVNLSQAQAASWRDVVLGATPVIIAAFAYPLGLQLVWEARDGRHKRIPHITDPVMDNTVARVILLTLGSLPGWVVLLLVATPPPPTTGDADAGMPPASPR